MAQVTKVTDYFVSRKRNNEAHSLKRQKLTDPKELFAQTTIDSRIQTSDGKQLIRCDVGGPAKKANTRQRRTTRARTSKSTGASKQRLLTDSKNSTTVLQKRLTKESNISEPFTGTAFDFKLTADLPSDCDLLVKDYDPRTTPSSTPTKRNSPNNKSIQTKRKRSVAKSDGQGQKADVTPTTSNSQQCRKKLDMPAVDASSSGSKNSTAGTVENVNDVTVEQTRPHELSNEAAEKIETEVAKEPTEKVVARHSKHSSAKPGDLKAKLSKCGKLADLKACLQRVKTLKTEISTSKKSAKSQSATVTGCQSVVAASSVPAYEKYRDLAVKIPTSLTLPYKYKLLEDMFRGTDTVVSMLYNRLERCTFDKLRRAVQDMLRKNFEPKHLGQIKTVYPESYELRQEKGVMESGVKSNKYQITVEPILQADKQKQVSKRKDGQPVFGSGEVMRRKESFKRRLFEIVKSHHQRFIEGLKPPVKVDPDKITRWHPKFLLDNVPDVEPAELPQPPETQRELVTARDVLNTARGKLPSRVERALQAVADASEKANNLKNVKKAKEADKLNIEKTTLTETKTASKTSGISSSLLERIRAKEALKAQAAMLRDETTEQEMEILARLPEIIKILRSYFITEKKATLTEDNVIVKLCDSYRSSISQSAVEKHIEYLVQTFPEWISRVSVSSGSYIKINKQTELSELNSKLKQLLKQKHYQLPAV